MPDWRRIVEEHSAGAWKTAYRMLGNQSDASDCLQEAYMAAFQVTRRTPVRDWGALLQRLAARRAIDRLRERYRSKERNAGELVERAGDGEAPHRASLNGELAEHIRRAVASLPQQQAEVFTLRFICEFEYGEIARELGIETGHVGVLLHRARVQLRNQLGAYLDRRPSHG